MTISPLTKTLWLGAAYAAILLASLGLSGGSQTERAADLATEFATNGYVEIKPDGLEYTTRLYSKAQHDGVNCRRTFANGWLGDEDWDGTTTLLLPQQGSFDNTKRYPALAAQEVECF